ncbi:MAG: 3-phosphoserine/phosphohydroxythreonine aminotransferase [Gimesia sp.]|jgi:phosphoserine aminotransferase|uniref:Phosphoserine aminotransferase n=1 Tax=Gimesia maris TaxID=122 RepID=A0A3D3RHF7_9PLAN|nr:3-phosphoserine/phosphohydroxythreonine aminotransferase [Gimesia sp.]HCO27498.1 3-phosphoserine/phosphohydroxythreonine transaminase [Gimesia maris]|tara:strand:- start:111068 stop:112153 length:1086 start_codon:yes stop_codon:yes gene_type:complete
MTERIYNFSAGPAALPLPVLEQAQKDLISLGDTGIGVLEHSHRSKAFLAVYEEAESLVRELASVPDNYKVLFLQGGASSQFFMIPMNLLKEDQTADYLVTGSWSKKAVKEARSFGNVNVACSSEDKNFSYIPEEVSLSENPAYVHFTSNNTIYGTEFATEPTVPAGVPLICDASSDIFSRPLDISKYGIVYAGAQKNLGPSGVTLVIIRDDLIEQGPTDIPTMLQYRTHSEAGSMYNTPPTFGIYVLGQVLKWLKDQGGLAAIQEKNQAKSGKLYDYLEQSKLFNATAAKQDRSLMNVTFVTGDADLDAQFISKATAAGLDGLKGHRSVGGMRASIYNAFPEAGVDKLIEMMSQFEQEHAS